MANSVTAIKSCRAGLKKKLAQTDNFLKYVEDSNKLISVNTKKMESVYNSDLNPEKQLATVLQINRNIRDIKDMTQLTMDASIAKLRKAQDDLMHFIEEYLKLKRYDAFLDKQKLNLEQVYSVQDNAAARPKSKWEYTHDNVYPHQQAISQPIVTSCNDSVPVPSTECSATSLTVKFKTFFDFHLSLDLKATKIGAYLGVVFRKKDAFNYYSLDVGEDFLRFRKMLNGKQTIISQSKIEPVLADKWFQSNIYIMKGTTWTCRSNRTSSAPPSASRSRTCPPSTRTCPDF